jgi:hypothetical protein
VLLELSSFSMLGILAVFTFEAEAHSMPSNRDPVAEPRLQMVIVHRIEHVAVGEVIVAGNT